MLVQPGPSLLARHTASMPASATATLDADLKDLASRGIDVINLTAGEMDFPTPPEASQGGTAAISEGFTRYTAVPGSLPLREAIGSWLAARHGTDYRPEEIVVSNGAKQSLFNAFSVLLDPGDEVIVAAPYWVSFPHMITLAGGVPITVQTGQAAGFKLSPQALRAHLSPRSKVLLLNNPTNPTGVVYSRAELEALAEAALDAGLVIISDEIYDQLVYEPASFVAVASLAREVRARTVTINGVSKTFGMTGWRIGYAAAPAPVARAMTAMQGHTTSAPSSISQRAAQAALSAANLAPELGRRRAELDHRRTLLISELASIPGLRPAVEPLGTFYLLAELTGCSDASAFAMDLLDAERVGVMPADCFGAPGHVRISFVVDVPRMLEALARIRRFAQTSALQRA
jgi:aspartate aminotransferase